MAEQSERRRILDMLASGQINADEAGELLTALDAGVDVRGTAKDMARHMAIAGALKGAGAERTKQIAKSLRITIDSGAGDSSGRVAVTVPLALAKFAGRLIPEDVRNRLQDEGIELAELLEALDQELPDGRLVDIDTSSPEGEGRQARIIVEVA